jgi:uncharacterized protein YbjT (DUF2867 family)
MRVAVVGGTGTIGALAVDELARRGHEAFVLSRHAPAVSTGAAYRQVDLTTGSGLPEALDGVEVVLDASNSTGARSKAVLVEGTRRLLRAGEEAGVAHHALISIVGIETVPIGYYRTKLAQENALTESPVPTSVLRCTQFHQLLAGVFNSVARFGVLPSGSIPLQPVDPREAAEFLIGQLEQGPWTDRREFAGPDIVTLGALARAWAAGQRRRRVLIPPPAFGAAGRGLRAGGLTSTSAARGQVSFDQWLRH